MTSQIVRKYAFSRICFQSSTPVCIEAFRFWVWGFALGFGVSVGGFWLSGFGLQISGFGFLVSGFEFRILGFGRRVRDTPDV